MTLASRSITAKKYPGGMIGKLSLRLHRVETATLTNQKAFMWDAFSSTVTVAMLMRLSLMLRTSWLQMQVWSTLPDSLRGYRK